jgi:sec-independent protein translocase protein TatB
LGPEKLPGMARTLGTWLQKLRRLSANLQAEVRDVMDDPAMQPIRELGEFAAQPRRKLVEYATAAEIEAAAEASPEAPPDIAGVIESRPADDTDGSGEADREGGDVAVGPDHPMERRTPTPPPDPT